MGRRLAVRTKGYPVLGWLFRVRHVRRLIERDVYVLYLASRDRRVPWYAKALAAAVLAYAVSPIDLIPDVIPVLGLLDDLVLVPLGLALARRLVPDAVLEEHRATAAQRFAVASRYLWLGAAIVIGMWLVTVAIIIAVLWWAFA